MTFRQRLPLCLFRKRMCGALALLSICATTVQAAIVFQDNFNRSGPLQGSTPSTTPGGTWTAQSGFATDGTKVNASACVPPGGLRAHACDHHQRKRLHALRHDVSRAFDRRHGHHDLRFLRCNAVLEWWRQRGRRPRHRHCSPQQQAGGSTHAQWFCQRDRHPCGGWHRRGHVMASACTKRPPTHGRRSPSNWLPPTR